MLLQWVSRLSHFLFLRSHQKLRTPPLLPMMFIAHHAHGIDTCNEYGQLGLYLFVYAMCMYTSSIYCSGSRRVNKPSKRFFPRRVFCTRRKLHKWYTKILCTNVTPHSCKCICSSTHSLPFGSVPQSWYGLHWMY